MLKFWKKKPVEPAATPDVAPPEDRPEKAADTASIDAGPAVAEALAETVLPEPEAPEVEPDVEEASIVEAAQPAKRSWRERLSGSVFAKSLTTLFVRHPKLDDDLLDELETTLITADVGVEASSN